MGADVGCSYAIGVNPRNHALVRDLPLQFGLIRQQYLKDDGISGGALFDFACRSAEAAGWRFVGQITGYPV